MSYREKSAWISFVTTLLIWGWFFAVLMREIGSGDPRGGVLMGTFIGCTIALVAVQVVLYVAITLCAPRGAEARTDERERLIDLKASRIAFVTLSILVMGTVIVVPLLAHAGPLLFPRDPMGGTLSVIGGSAFLAVVVGELVHAGWQILLFRRAA